MSLKVQSYNKRPFYFKFNYMAFVYKLFQVYIMIRPQMPVRIKYIPIGL